MPIRWRTKEIGKNDWPSSVNNTSSRIRREPPSLCPLIKKWQKRLAEGVGFEPTVRLPVRLISSQVPSTTQPPFHRPSISHAGDGTASGFAEIVADSELAPSPTAKTNSPS